MRTSPRAGPGPGSKPAAARARRAGRGGLARLAPLLLPLALAALTVPATLPAGPGPGDILVLTVRGPITPAIADYVERGVARGGDTGAALVVLELDTPGGLDSSMRVITQAILNAAVPVAVFVAPSGSRAASAGTFITLAADVAAMAPGTTLGAAHPVSLVGSTDETMAAKIANDAAAYIRSLAERHGRNGDWAEKAVRESASLTETQALAAHVVDLVAPDLPALLAALEGREVQRPEGAVILRTAGRPVTRLPMDWRGRLLGLLADPNVAYLLLVVGGLGVFFELSHPGVIFPGVIGGICLILAFYSLQALPVSAAGALLLVLAGLLFFAELKVASSGILGVGGIVALTFGSLMLVRTPLPWLRISLVVVLPTVAVTAFAVLVVLRLVLRARRLPPSGGREGMVGAVGEALADLTPRGQVFVRGETWEAESPQAVRRGDRVRVVAVRGLTLEVRAHPEVRP